MLGIYFLAVCMYILIGVVFYSLCFTAKQSDEIMEQQAKEYWSTVYNCKGSDVND